MEVKTSRKTLPCLRVEYRKNLRYYPTNTDDRIFENFQGTRESYKLPHESYEKPES